MPLLLLFIFCIIRFPVQAQENHELIRRVAVFPLEVDKEHTKAGEEAWWKMREELTRDKRFLVASRNFLERKDLYQPRGLLSPADAIILGELLDANMVVTASLKSSIFKVMAYEAKYGRLIWQHEIKLHPSVPVGEQLPKLGENLIRDLMASLPYHGFVIVDALIGRPYFQNDGAVLIQFEVSEDSPIEVGEQFQLIRVLHNNSQPLLLGGATIEVFAEGKITQKKGAIATGKVERITSVKEIAENSLVRFPREMKRLKELYALRDSLKRRVNPEYLAPELAQINIENQETKPLVAALTFLGNLAAILLFAF